jgi:hypothetical protein
MTTADAGQGAAPAASAPISGSVAAAPIAAPSAEPTPVAEKPKTGMEAAWERAQAKLGVKVDGNGIHDAPAKPLEAEKPVPLPDTPETGKPAVEAPEPLKAPERWTKEEKDAFAKQPRDVQEFILSRDKSFDSAFRKKSEELAKDRKFAEGMREVFNDPLIRQQMQASGVDEVVAVKKLVSLQQKYMNDPVGYIAGLMRQRNIDPRVFLQGQNAQGQPQPNAAQMLAPIVGPLQERLQAMEQYHAAQLAEQQARQEKAIEDTLTSAMQDLDDTGSPRFPHVERVANTMADIIESDRDGSRFGAMDPRQRFEAAYQIAVLMDPDIRAEIVASEAAKKASSMEQALINGRLKAAATVKPSASTSVAASRKSGIEGAFERAQRRLGQR